MKRRNTATKEAVLSILSTSGLAMSQDAIEKRIDVGINRATIYRILNRYCEDGILHKIVADDGKQYFSLNVKCEENQKPVDHFHFRCTCCETISCLPVPVDFSLPSEYKVERVNCILTGVCKDCT